MNCMVWMVKAFKRTTFTSSLRSRDGTPLALLAKVMVMLYLHAVGFTIAVRTRRGGKQHVAATGPALTRKHEAPRMVAVAPRLEWPLTAQMCFLLHQTSHRCTYRL